MVKIEFHFDEIEYVIHFDDQYDITLIVGPNN